jgi:hypothetical protein
MSVIASVALGAGSSSPEEALKKLELAYINEDIDAAVAAMDFEAEARRMLDGLSSGEALEGLSDDREILESTAEVLKLSFMKEIQDGGFPDFKSVKCSAVVAEKLSEDTVVLRENCVHPVDGVFKDELYATKSGDGWRISGIKRE